MPEILLHRAVLHAAILAPFDSTALRSGQASTRSPVPAALAQAGQARR